MNLFVQTSARAFDEVASRFPEAARRHGFGVLAQHDLRAKMREKGVAFEPDCLVFEVCDPQRARDVLESDLSVSTVLPCRVSLYRGAEGTRLAMVRPTALLGLFSSPGLREAAEEIERRLVKIIEESA